MNMKNEININSLRDTQAIGLPRIAIISPQNTFSKSALELSAFSNKDIDADQFKEGIILDLPKEKQIIVHLLSVDNPFLNIIRNNAIDAILIDNRTEEKTYNFGETLAGSILPELLAGAPLGRNPPRRSMLVILSNDETTSNHAYVIGTFQLGGVLVNPKSLVESLQSAYQISRPSTPGKVALCLAGGGIEGMFYEIGVLRALNAHLKGNSIIDFDIFAGISAGAIIGAFLANGILPSEIADALHGRSSKVAPVTRSMLFDPNIGEVLKRIFGAAGDMMRGRWLTNPIDTAIKITPTALFSGDKLRNYLERELTKQGLTNDFERLKKDLFVGATDQDTGEHVSFGSKGYKNVSISRAIRASTAMTPYYNPEKIGDRYFVDGIFTKTLDIDIAVAAGARLIICVDPLTPVQTDRPGYVSDKGGFFNTVQSIKSMIKTRFSESINRTEEVYPDVSVFVFSPTPKDMEKMSGTMMRFFYRTETEEMAFHSASNRIMQDFEWLASDLARHGYQLTKKIN